ncbi:hypothetical protein GQ55_3G239500 [Panicum hallii var. hallii]|uniref:Uncharacterized protein n=2 Tax=Panicum hallii TaxID=206008 RepID=A0A2T7ECS9_9POAL|nr:hypothetical protein PAHAL_3G248600 [Panicum hallii]PUZ65629.1 hypothetical protein GQ55_3G239500 [Panicum hallii var. hallii]
MTGARLRVRRSSEPESKPLVFRMERMGELSRACGRDLHAISEISLVLVTARAARTERDDLDQHLALGTRRPARSHG